MTNKYFVDKYDYMFIELFSKKTDWEKIENIKDISGEIDFCYNVDNNDIESKLKLISKEDFTKYNSIEVNKSYITYDKVVNIYILLISEKDVYIYKEGKVNTDKVRYYSEQSYFNYTFEQIKYDVSNKINPFLEENKLHSNGFNIIGMKYGIDEDYNVNLLEIDTDLDLSIEIDKLHKMKLHYWLFFDILNKFVFKNNLHHRWEKCEENIKVPNKINKPKTYLINRSNILKKILNNNGWIEGKINEKVDFSYWDVFDAKGVTIKSIVKTIPRNITNLIDNKKSMYEILKKNNLTHFLPKTYTQMINIDKNIFTNDKIYFLKKHNGSGNKDVHVIKEYDQFINIINDNYEEYILQEEVKNMYLHNKKKVVIRAYGLVTSKPFNNYLYYDAKFDIYKNDYNNNNLSNEIHNDEYNSVVHQHLSNMEFKEIVFEKMKNICNELNIFWNYKTENEEYIILGYDFILDTSYNVYLIEVNSYPNMVESKDQPLKNEIFDCFSNLVVFKNNKPHKFINVNNI